MNKIPFYSAGSLKTKTAQQSVHLTLGILWQSQAVFYALAFFWLDGFAVPAPAQVTQSVSWLHHNGKVYSMSISTIIFDLFGTLVSGNAWHNHEAVVQEMALMLGAPVSAFVDLFEGETREDREIGAFSSIEDNIAFICSKLGITTSSDLISQAALQRYEFTKQALDLRADTINTLVYLQEHGYKTGLISDCSPDVPPLWLKTPMAKYIAEPIFSSDVGVKKPSPKIYELAIEKYQAIPSQCLYVGDGGSYELTGAKKMGMMPVLLKIPGDEISDRMRPDAQSWHGLTISSLSQVKELL